MVDERDERDERTHGEKVRDLARDAAREYWTRVRERVIENGELRSKVAMDAYEAGVRDTEKVMERGLQSLGEEIHA